MKRIVKETLTDGEIRYVIESNRLFWIIPVKWYVITDDFVKVMSFPTYKLAQEYLGIDTNPPVKREIIK